MNLTIDFINNKYIIMADINKKLADYKEDISKFTNCHIDSYVIKHQKILNIDWDFTISKFLENPVLYFVHKIR